MNETRYPLCWPANWKRTTSRTHALFGKAQQSVGQFSRIGKTRLSLVNAIDRIAEELRRMGIKEENVIISTNIPLSLSGVPRGDRGEPSDPGAAIYWTHKGKNQCMAIDRYKRVADNLAAVAATLEALRAIERHGGGSILDRAFLGFAALPTSTFDWREFFIVSPALPKDRQIYQVESAYRAQAKELHPDKQSGDHDRMVELNRARDAALRELGA